MVSAGDDDVRIFAHIEPQFLDVLLCLLLCLLPALPRLSRCFPLLFPLPLPGFLAPDVSVSENARNFEDYLVEYFGLVEDLRLDLLSDLLWDLLLDWDLPLDCLDDSRLGALLRCLDRSGPGVVESYGQACRCLSLSPTLQKYAVPFAHRAWLSKILA